MLADVSISAGWRRLQEQAHAFETIIWVHPTSADPESACLRQHQPFHILTGTRKCQDSSDSFAQAEDEHSVEPRSLQNLSQRMACHPERHSRVQISSLQDAMKPWTSGEWTLAGPCSCATLGDSAGHAPMGFGFPRIQNAREVGKNA